MAGQSSAEYRRTLGRYALFGEIAAGGMATVHLARLLGASGFARTVAVKRPHPHLAKDPGFAAMFLEEARLAARVRHPNVVATLDVVSDEGELFLVMEYVAGESLSRLVRKAREAGERMPPRYAVAVLSAALEGLHAAHEATGEDGAPLGIVHRDVSPQNIHVGTDGIARVLDFGIAKATNRVEQTLTGQLKGKVSYMSPEQLARGPIDRRADVYSASVVLWQALTAERLFKADDIPALAYAILHDEIPPPSALVPDLPRGLDEIVMRGLERDPAKRWASAREMAVALEGVLTPAPAREIGGWVEQTAGERLRWRLDLVHQIESETSPSRLPLRQPDSCGPIEVSGVVRHTRGSRADARDEARTHEGEERETLCEPAPARDVEVARASSRRHALVAVLLLVAAAGALTFRLAQLRDGAGGEEPPAHAEESDPEPAIGIELERPASPPSSAPAKPRAKPRALRPIW